MSQVVSLKDRLAKHAIKPKPATVKGHVIPAAPEPYIPQHISTLPAREWLFGNHLARGLVSVTVAPGAAGKSSLISAQAVSLATGRDFLDMGVTQKLNVWLYNLEDSKLDIERRIAAAIELHRIPYEDLSRGLFINSGLDNEICVARRILNDVVIVEPVFEALKSYIRANAIDYLCIDPFVSSHRLAESDNDEIDAVSKRWAQVAAECDVSIELVHHTRKSGEALLSIQDARGASALANTARAGRVLNPVPKTKLAEWGVTDGGTYFYADDDKANWGPKGRAVFRTVGVDPMNGDKPYPAVERFYPPDPVTVSATDEEVESAMAIINDADPARAYPSAADWIGNKLMKSFGWDKSKTTTLLSRWEGEGRIRKDYVKQSNGKDVPVWKVV